MTRSIRRPLTGAALATAGLMAAVPLAWGQLAEVPVKARPNPILETTAAASADYFAWAENSRARTKTFNVYEQVMDAGTPSGPAFRVNASGSKAFGGGIAGTRLAYQQIVGGQSDIRFWNLAEHRRSNPPPGVNTRNWEWRPSITDTWILFGRATATASNVVLENLATHSARRLASVPLNRAGTALAVPGQVNGGYAAYAVCTPACSVHLYDIVAHTDTRVSRPAGIDDYDPAVTAGGTLYWLRAGTSCGAHVRIMARPLGGPGTAIHRFPAGIDADRLQTFNDGSHDQLFYTRVTCRTSGENIFRAAA